MSGTKYTYCLCVTCARHQHRLHRYFPVVNVNRQIYKCRSQSNFNDVITSYIDRIGFKVAVIHKQTPHPPPHSAHPTTPEILTVCNALSQVIQMCMSPVNNWQWLPYDLHNHYWEEFGLLLFTTYFTFLIITMVQYCGICQWEAQSTRSSSSDCANFIMAHHRELVTPQVWYPCWLVSVFMRCTLIPFMLQIFAFGASFTWLYSHSYAP